MKVDINVPRLVSVNDYHELCSMESVFQTLNSELKVSEIGYGEGYVGVIYCGTKPSKEEIIALAVKQNFYLETLDGEEVEWPDA